MRIPWVTGAALTVAAVAALLQYTVPSVVPALERNAAALADGQWWRVITPVLVQTLGWYQVVVNGFSLLVVGVVAERLVGGRWWLVLAVTGTCAGQVAAYGGSEPGGGTSILICGLAGGSLIALLTRGSRHPLTTVAIVAYVAALTGWRVGGPRAAAVAGLVAGALLLGAAARWWPKLALVSLTGAALCVAGLALGGDIHGIPLAAGAMVYGVASSDVLTKKCAARSRYCHSSVATAGSSARLSTARRMCASHASRSPGPTRNVAWRIRSRGCPRRSE
jgi:hypothetical protein